MTGQHAPPSSGRQHRLPDSHLTDLPLGAKHGKII
jgi:hypothetical protein